MHDTPESVTLIPIDRIEVLNSRDRNMKVFEEIVDNIRAIGLKKPITVTQRQTDDGEPSYLLVCGEGRLNAFRMLGESHIPALVVDVDDEDAFIMSLAENIARRGHRPLEILADIEVLRDRGYSAEVIIDKTGRKILVVNGPRRDGDPARLVADSRLAREKLGWQPQYADLATIIEHAWKWETRGG